MTRDTRELGVVPGSRLENLLSQLPRRVRRTFLAALTGADTPRRARLERRARREIARLGIVMMLLLSLAACHGDGYVATDDESMRAGDWVYVTGPNGEECLVLSRSHGLGLDCETVNTP